MFPCDNCVVNPLLQATRDDTVVSCLPIKRSNTTKLETSPFCATYLIHSGVDLILTKSL